MCIRDRDKVYYLDYLNLLNTNKKVVNTIKLFFENSSIEKISENLKNDIKALAKYGININGNLFDTMIAHYLINPDINHNTNIISENYLNYSLKEEENKINYTADKANIIFQLKDPLKKEL